MATANELTLEQEIQDKGLTAPRLTPDLIDSKITHEQYFHVDNTTVTICYLALENGFGVVGESAAVSLDNFDVEIGKKVAKDNAREKIWALEGYLLKQKLYEANKAR